MDFGLPSPPDPNAALVEPPLPSTVMEQLNQGEFIRPGTSAGLTGKKLVPSITISDNPSEVFCIRFSPDGRLLAAGCGDGCIRVFNTQTGRLAYNLNAGNQHQLPVTCVRFRPVTETSRTRNVLLAVNAAGEVQHWHITSGKCLHTISHPENELYTSDYRADGAYFATAGKDYAVRVYDEATKSIVCEMRGGRTYTQTPGHSNRVFSAKWCPIDPNILLTAGWDNTVQIWDVRMEHSARSIFGPHVCGDSLDMASNQILTGSWRPEDPLELWDYGSGQRIEAIPWHQSMLKGEPCLLYAASFSKASSGGQLIAAGGSGANECKIFDRNSKKVVGTVQGLSRAVFCLDFNHDASRIAIAGGDSTVRLIDIEQSDP